MHHIQEREINPSFPIAIPRSDVGLIETQELLDPFSVQLTPVNLDNIPSGHVIAGITLLAPGVKSIDTPLGRIDLHQNSQHPGVFSEVSRRDFLRGSAVLGGSTAAAVALFRSGVWRLAGDSGLLTPDGSGSSELQDNTLTAIQGVHVPWNRVEEAEQYANQGLIKQRISDMVQKLKEEGFDDFKLMVDYDEQGNRGKGNFFTVINALNSRTGRTTLFLLALTATGCIISKLPAKADNGVDIQTELNGNGEVEAKFYIPFVTVTKTDSQPDPTKTASPTPTTTATVAFNATSTSTPTATLTPTPTETPSIPQGDWQTVFYNEASLAIDERGPNSWINIKESGAVVERLEHDPTGAYQGPVLYQHVEGDLPWDQEQWRRRGQGFKAFFRQFGFPNGLTSPLRIRTAVWHNPILMPLIDEKWVNLLGAYSVADYEDNINPRTPIRFMFHINIVLGRGNHGEDDYFRLDLGVHDLDGNTRWAVPLADAPRFYSETWTPVSLIYDRDGMVYALQGDSVVSSIDSNGLIQGLLPRVFVVNMGLYCGVVDPDRLGDFIGGYKYSRDHAVEVIR